jgi:(2Fe-2S) ferredoxin
LRARLAALAPPVAVEEWDCMRFCPRGPHVVLYPEGTWYAGVLPDDLDGIVAHIQGGEPPNELTAKIDAKLHALLLTYLDSQLRASQ